MSKIYVTSELYVDDRQLVKRLNLPKADADFFKYHEVKNGFPSCESDFANKRYWPAVVAWFDAECGLGERRPYLVGDDIEAYKRYPQRKKRKTRWGE
jgi:hypothetical protein